MLDLLEKEALDAFNKRNQIKPLTDAEKEEIFKTIRFSFMTHQQLLSLLSEPVFEAAKEFIREGISFRLISYESEVNEDLNFKINTKPRTSYYLPDIVLADVENEQVDTKNPLAAILKKAVRANLKEQVIDNLTDEQQTVMRQQKAH